MYHVEQNAIAKELFKKETFMQIKNESTYLEMNE